MRKGGRPVRSVFRPSELRYSRFQVKEWLIPGGFRLRLSPSEVGVVLTVSVVWTGRLVLQRVWDWSDWLLFDEQMRRSLVMGYFRKPEPPPSPVNGDGKGFVDEELARQYPVLEQYLTSETWEDGKPRETGSMTVFRQDGVYKVVLSDKHANMALWASSQTFLGLLEALEARLTEPVVEWRRQKPKPKRG